MTQNLYTVSCYRGTSGLAVVGHLLLRDHLLHKGVDRRVAESGFAG